MNLGEYRRPWVFPGHVACRLCEANGLQECEILNGIHEIDKSKAFHFAAERSGKQVLIDASKDIGWCKNFLGQPGLDLKFIHLIRHPAGFIESEGRRIDKSAEQLLLQWKDQNSEIRAFLRDEKLSFMTCCYDNLADSPDAYFPSICEFVGQNWETKAVNYWEVPHHGLGGNGAASVYLRDRKISNYISGDETFYRGIIDRKVSADIRFRERLPADLIAAILDDPEVKDIGASAGARWES